MTATGAKKNAVHIASCTEAIIKRQNRRALTRAASTLIPRGGLTARGRSRRHEHSRNPRAPTQPQPARPLQAVAPPPATTAPPRTPAPPTCTALAWPCAATHKSMDSAAELGKGPLHNCVSCALPLCANHHAVNRWVCSNKALSTCSSSWRAQPQTPAMSHVQLVSFFSTLEPVPAAGATTAPRKLEPASSPWHTATLASSTSPAAKRCATQHIGVCARTMLAAAGKEGAILGARN